MYSNPADRQIASHRIAKITIKAQFNPHINHTRKTIKSIVQKFARKWYMWYIGAPPLRC